MGGSLDMQQLLVIESVFETTYIGYCVDALANLV
jgi:hypothetical protein